MSLARSIASLLSGGGSVLLNANNLSDVANAATARTNLGAVNKAGDTMAGNLAVPVVVGTSGKKLELRSGDSSYGFALQNVSGIDFIAADATGRVTMPYQPYASFENGTSMATSPGSPVVVSPTTVYSNLGSCLNASTGVFTCPVTGVYAMSHTIMAIASSYQLDFDYQKNGLGLLSSYSSNVTYDRNSGFIYVPCSAGDTLRFVLQHGQTHQSYNRFNFMLVA